MKDFITSLPGRIVIITALLIILGGVVLFVVIRSKVDHASEDPSEETSQVVSSSDSESKTGEKASSESSKESEEKILYGADAVKDYYQQTSKSIKIIEVADATEVMTETDVLSCMTDRGFDLYPITYEFGMNGEDLENGEEAEAVSGSEEKHPMYETIYVAANGDWWFVYVVNGALVAAPVSYNLQSEREVEVLVSESEKITSYDPFGNVFYETVPKETDTKVIVVPKIDAETLNQLTIEEINKL